MSRNLRVFGGLVLGLMLSAVMISGAMAADTGANHVAPGGSDGPLVALPGGLDGIGEMTAPAQQGTATATPEATESPTASPTGTSTPSGGVNAGLGGADSSGGLNYAMLALGGLVVAGGATALMMSRRPTR